MAAQSGAGEHDLEKTSIILLPAEKMLLPLHAYCRGAWWTVWVARGWHASGPKQFRSRPWYGPARTLLGARYFEPFMKVPLLRPSPQTPHPGTHVHLFHVVAGFQAAACTLFLRHIVHTVQALHVHYCKCTNYTFKNLVMSVHLAVIVFVPAFNCALPGLQTGDPRKNDINCILGIAVQVTLRIASHP